MGEQSGEEMKDPRKIFIDIVLYLLLALAFFSNYYIGKGLISTGAILIFIFGVLSLIPLTIIYTRKCRIIWAYFSITPFILIILFNLTLLYGMALGGYPIKEGGLVKILQIFFSFTHDSLWTIIILMLIFLIGITLFQIREILRNRNI